MGRVGVSLSLWRGVLHELGSLSCFIGASRERHERETYSTRLGWGVDSRSRLPHALMVCCVAFACAPTWHTREAAGCSYNSAWHIGMLSQRGSYGVSRLVSYALCALLCLVVRPRPRCDASKKMPAARSLGGSLRSSLKGLRPGVRHSPAHWRARACLSSSVCLPGVVPAGRAACLHLRVETTH